MTNIEQELLRGLNVQQQQAVMAGPGPVLVLAGPGSGKTRVLTHRIAYIISHFQVRPPRVLAVTFTNKAAREMEQRVQQMLGAKTRGLVLGTFHGVCARFLRREADALPVNANFAIFDADDQLKLVERALEELNIDKKRHTPRSVHGAISYAKNELLMPEDLTATDYRSEVIRRVFRRYQELLITNNALDFDDLLVYTVRLLEEQPEVRERYARTFEHVLVDEFQDTNLAQYAIVKHLASFHRNIFVVGDVDQSIYRWRGADYRNVLRFREDYPDAQVVLLEQNYRSTQTILDIAMAVINENPNRTPKKLFTVRGAGKKAVLHEAYDDYAEAAYVVEQIALLIQKKEAQPGDIAVMYRTNAQSRVLEEAFLRANLPYKIVGAQRFYGRREVKDIIAYLRVISNPRDEVSMVRIINVPPRKIGTKTLEMLRMLAQRAGCTMGEYLLELPEEEAVRLGTGGGKALLAFRELYAQWRALGEDADPRTVMDRVLMDVNYREYIDDGSEEGFERWENVMELHRLAAENSGLKLAAFLEQIALVSDQDTLEASSQAPTLLTLHAAKGLEFPVVFIVGLNDGVLPHIRSFDDEEQMMEERRLFYVGITRAKDRLFLTYSQTGFSQGYADVAEPSRFLERLSSDLFEPTPKNERRKGYSGGASWGGTSPKSSSMAPAVEECRYHAGLHVQHPLWGEGLVLNSVLEGNEEIVDIFFENVGLKRVIASMAKLQVMIKD